MIKLRKTECGDKLLQTSDGQWFTNGHWMIRESLCEKLKSAPALDPDRRPDYDNWRKRGAPLSKYIPAKRSWLTVEGQEALTVDGKIAAWANPTYLDLLDGLGAEIYYAGSLEPLAFAIGSLTDQAIVAWLMPMHMELSDTHRTALAEWLGEHK